MEVELIKGPWENKIISQITYRRSSIGPLPFYLKCIDPRGVLLAEVVMEQALRAGDVFVGGGRGDGGHPSPAHPQMPFALHLKPRAPAVGRACLPVWP